MANKLNDQAAEHPELREQAKKLEEQAEALQRAADDPQIKKNLIAATKALSPQKGPYIWDPEWKQFRTSEYYATSGMILGSATSAMVLHQTDVRWQGGVGPDDVIRNALLITDPNTKSMVDTATDVGVNALTAWSALEPLIFAWQRGDSTLAVQSTLIDLESYAAMTLLTTLSKDLTARQRPSGGDNQSFWSGHTAQAFTAAGLLCTHHTYMSLYGNKTADNSACWAAMTMASLVGLGRIASDNHYASDVAVGAAIGLFAGMVLPRILHYNKGKNLKASKLKTTPPLGKKRVIHFKFLLGTMGDKGIGPGAFIMGTF
jgi:membrane-associated phospholipid phosphatase